MTATRKGTDAQLWHHICLFAVEGAALLAAGLREIGVEAPDDDVEAFRGTGRKSSGSWRNILAGRGG